MTFILRSQQCMLQVVMAAVAENGIALKYAAPELQEDCNLAVSGELCFYSWWGVSVCKVNSQSVNFVGMHQPLAQKKLIK